MALGRPNVLTDLMSRYGISSEDLVTRIYGNEPKAVNEGLKTLDLVLDYRNTKADTVRKFAKATGATEAEVEAAVADVELYKKEFKPELDKEVQAQIDEVRKAAKEQEDRIYAEYDEKVKNVITESVYQKGSDWQKAKAEEEAAKKTKKAKKETVVEAAEAPVEEAGPTVDPFDNL